jgi:tetratricopeptide (TPR) repeat protein
MMGNEEPMQVDSPAIDAPLSTTEKETEAQIAEQKRQEANQAYKSGRYREAICMYRTALDVCPSATLYGNLAAAQLMLNDYKQAIISCQQAIAMDPKFLKV